LLIVLLPAAEQVGGVELIVGVAGVANIAALLNDADAGEVQLPLFEVTV